jgi:hypothetical protein
MLIPDRIRIFSILDLTTERRGKINLGVLHLCILKVVDHLIFSTGTKKVESDDTELKYL